MIYYFLVFVAVFAWDALKKKMRGPRKQEFTVDLGNTPVKAKCGCLVIPRQPYQQSAQMVRPCAAHGVIMEAFNP